VTDPGWRWEHDAAVHWLLVDEGLADGEADPVLAVCADIDGLFADPPTLPPAVLRGCRPGPLLQAALSALRPGAAAHRRRVAGRIFMVTPDGTPIRMLGPRLAASVTGSRPSALGAGLLDVAFDDRVLDPKPAGARQIWTTWRSRPPVEPGGWTGLDSILRDEWSGAALGHNRYAVPDQPAGTTYHLDGRHVTDLEGFFCAIGEAINGPGGYFGWTADALHDCLTGGWGASTPFRLVWHDAAVARAHLVDPGARHTMDQLVTWLAEDGVEVELR
jgi:RNAse (barnase) inhibitor barstar